jgi:hypothetical protein
MSSEDYLLHRETFSYSFRFPLRSFASHNRKSSWVVLVLAKMKHILLHADLILLHVQVHGLAEFIFVQAKLHFHEQIYHFFSDNLPTFGTV